LTESEATTVYPRSLTAEQIADHIKSGPDLAGTVSPKERDVIASDQSLNFPSIFGLKYGELAQTTLWAWTVLPGPLRTVISMR